MFERFTDQARRVVVLAQESASGLGHNYIGTEHILLGLVSQPDSLAAKALASLKIDLDSVRSQVEELIGRGEGHPLSHLPFTSRAKKVLELSLREALQLGHNYIGTEHILLGLIREGDGVAATVLIKLGANLSRVRQQVVEMLQGPGASAVEDQGLVTGALASRMVTTSFGSAPGYSGWTRLASAGMGGVTAVAAELGHERIGTEHILLWLLRTSKGGAAQALRDAEVDVEGLRTQLEQQLDEAGGSVDP